MSSRRSRSTATAFGCVPASARLTSQSSFARAREKSIRPTVVVIDIGRLAFRLAAIRDRQRDRRADHDVEDALIGIDAGPLAAPHVAAQIDDLDPVEALAHHLAQAGIGPAGQKLAVGDESDDAAPRRVLRLENFQIAQRQKATDSSGKVLS